MEKIKFNNGKLTVLQISDAQDLQWMRKTMVHMLLDVCDKVKPDLIIFSGDNILGNHICDRRFLSGKRDLTRAREYRELKKAINNLLDIPNKKNIPFAAIFGNHDDRNSFTKDEQADIFRANRLNRGFVNSGDICGTDCLSVYSSDGEKKLMNLWMIDTAWYDRDADKCYEAISKESVDLFIAENNKQKKVNGGKPYPGVIFMHIPLSASCRLTEECSGAQSSVRCGDKFCRLKDGIDGELNEPVTPVKDEYGFYDAVLDCGGIKSIVSGHNHLNCYDGVLDGIRFIATPGASFRSYGNHLRGVRVFEFSEDAPGDFGTYTLDYKDILGDNVLTKLRYFWDADEMEKKKAVMLGAAAVGSAAFAAWCSVYRAVKKRS